MDEATLTRMTSEELLKSGWLSKQGGTVDARADGSIVGI